MVFFNQNDDIHWKEPLIIFATTVLTILALRIVAHEVIHIDTTLDMILGTVVQDIMIIFLIWFYLTKRHHCGLRRIQVNLISLRSVAHSVMAGVAVMFLMVITIQIMNQFLPNGIPPQNVESIMSFGSPIQAFLISFLLMAFLAPVTEELLFRGYLYESLRQSQGSRIAMFLTSFCFGVVHGDLYRFLPLMLGGYLLNLMAVREKSIISSMIMHGTWNGCFVIAQFLVITPK